MYYTKEELEAEIGKTVPQKRAWLKNNTLLARCQTLEVGHLVWVKQKGSVYWPAIVTSLLYDPTNPDLACGDKYAVITYLERMFRSGEIHHESMILLDEICLDKQWQKITLLNRTIVKKKWIQPAEFKQAFEAVRALLPVDFNRRNQMLSDLSELFVKGKLPENLEITRAMEVSVDRPGSSESAPSGQRALGRYNLRSSARLARQAPTVPMHELNRNQLATETIIRINGVPVNTSNHPGLLKIIMEETTRAFARLDKSCAFQEVTDTRCSRCQKSVPYGHASLCHGLSYHKECLRPVSKNLRLTEDNEELANTCGECGGRYCLLCFEDKEEPLIKCQVCSSAFHETCLIPWPQAVFLGSSRSLICPRHFCHTCKAEQKLLNRPRTTRVRCDKSVKCIYCLATYHKGCVPAGSGDYFWRSSTTICPRHRERANFKNIEFGCFRCFSENSENFVRCVSCSLGYHATCAGYTNLLRITYKLSLAEFAETFRCESCFWGLYPLYGQVVWLQKASSQFWPCRILYPSEQTYRKRERGSFCVKLFGPKTSYCDSVSNAISFNGAGIDFLSALTNLTEQKGLKGAFMEAKYFLELHEQHYRIPSLPAASPEYKKIERNVIRYDWEGAKPLLVMCKCVGSDKPCRFGSACTNRAAKRVCDDYTCKAGDRCQNHDFARGVDLNHFEAFITGKRGWGLRTLKGFEKNDFVMEYVGELISCVEKNVRMDRKQQGDEVYIFEYDFSCFIDAEMFGSLSRFINHSCDPNCVMEKYIWQGKPAFGIYAICNINASDELTIDYEKSEGEFRPFKCFCSSANCKSDVGTRKENYEARPPRKEWIKRRLCYKSDMICAICQSRGANTLCHQEDCPRLYHNFCLNANRTQRSRRNDGTPNTCFTECLELSQLEAFRYEEFGGGYQKGHKIMRLDFEREKANNVRPSSRAAEIKEDLVARYMEEHNYMAGPAFNVKNEESNKKRTKEPLKDSAPSDEIAGPSPKP